MKKAKLFQNGRSQAVQLPKEFHFDGNEVYIKKVGKTTILLPVENPWQPLFDSLSKFSADFMNDRKQPKQQQRKNLF